MGYLLDTNICIALLKENDPNLSQKVKSTNPQDCFLCSVVKAELFFGARKSQNVEKNLALLQKFFAGFESIPFDDRSAEFYGISRSLVEKEGRPVGGNDLLIASIALASNLTVISRNRKEFQRIPSLRFETW